MSRQISSDLFSLLARLRPLADICVMLMAAFMAALTMALIRHEPALMFLRLEQHQIAIIVALCLLPLILSQYGAYRSQRDVPLLLELSRLWYAIGFLVAMLVLLGAVSKSTEQVSRLWFGFWFVYGVSLLTALRLLVRRMLKSARVKGYDTRNVVLVGSSELARKVIMHLALNSESGYRLVGYVADEPSAKMEFSELPYLGTPQGVRQRFLAQQLVADQIWVAIDEYQPGRMRRVLEIIAELPHVIRIVPEGLLATLCELPSSKVAGLTTLEMTQPYLLGWGRLIKALEDRVLGFLILLLIWPLFPVIALLIRLDSKGPILFRQRRHGWNGAEFTLLKFRTMVQHPAQGDGVPQATRDDPRVTNIGRLLRRTSLDELPQIFNVLSGSMSLVGPRPHAIEHNQYYSDIIESYMHRHRVKPGMTGWAQINGFRGETETLEKMRRRVEYDLYYIENWSVGFDIVIIVLTVFRGMTSDQAY
ncbi:MAG: undecaprenyl-phosphate glucose phosphotransferase [Stenotrophobium sp.]